MKLKRITFIIILAFTYSCTSTTDTERGKNSTGNAYNRIDNNQKEYDEVKDTIALNSCNYNVVYDEKEYTSDSITNWFWGLRNFDTTNSNCWEILAEHYFNLVPDVATKRQNVYFILCRDSLKIKSLDELFRNKLQSDVIGLFEYGRGIETYKFTVYPFK